MVELSKLNGDKFFLNEKWIEVVESLPDTTITLSSGNKFVVLEKMEDVIAKILNWQRHMREQHPAGGRRSQPPRGQARA